MVATCRLSSKILDQRTRFENPNSSSIVTNTTPLAVPGRCRQITMPATLTLVPDRNERMSREERLLRKARAEQPHRVVRQRYARSLVVEDELLGARHPREVRPRLLALGPLEQTRSARSDDLPDRLAATTAQLVECATQDGVRR